MFACIFFYIGFFIWLQNKFCVIPSGIMKKDENQQNKFLI
jgi:hypothetical protein